MHRFSLALGAALLGLVGLTAAASGQTAEAMLPEDARDAVNDIYRGWQVATVDGDATTCAAGAGAGPIQMDLDGDLRMDYALAIQTGSEVRLVALLSRAEGFLAIDLDTLGDRAASGYLSISPRGSVFRNPGTSMTDYLLHDTLTVLRCGETSRTVYQWRGYRFEKIEFE